jgi:hypothetical protein
MITCCNVISWFQQLAQQTLLVSGTLCEWNRKSIGSQWKGPICRLSVLLSCCSEWALTRYCPFQACLGLAHDFMVLTPPYLNVAGDRSVDNAHE